MSNIRQIATRRIKGHAEQQQVDDASRSINDIANTPIMRGNFVPVFFESTYTFATDGPFRLTHGLGRPIEGIFLAYQDQPLVTFNGEDKINTNNRPQDILFLNLTVGTARTNLKFWVF